ncbi:MAG: DUF4270 domain-containing protein [Bacteroidales bacterium]|nr:DUF4270 domain-containing protein [Bacteroidales bacterium]MDD3859611.1 DUF4270 domain-containing protein [Bacteroidales bacterium]
MKKNSYFYILSLCFLLLVLGFNSCNEDDSEIGLGIIPGSDKILLYKDTIGVECYTVRDDNIATDERTLSPLGSYNDPIFGFSKASFACQARISSNNVDFDTVEVINSLKLHLKYDSFYGDPSSSQTVNVYRLKKDIYIDSVYYSEFSLDPSEYEFLSTAPLAFNPEDSIMTIELPLSLAESFVYGDSTNFIDNTTFNDFFKGFYVTTDNLSTGGCIYSINLVDPESKMALYYNDSAIYNFYINSKSAVINMFEHDYSTALAEIQAALNDTTALYDYCYVQSMGGLKAKIKFPELQTLFDSTNILINKAQLKITIKSGTEEGLYLPPPKMTLVAILESGKYDFITDYKVNNLYFGGSLESDEYTYVFNIPFHIQELINGNEDYGIYLFAVDNRTKPYRSVIYANDNSDKSMKLELYYSKY